MNVGQDQFVRAILAADAPVPEGLLDPAGRPAGRRFNVYRNNVIVSLTEALETAFPVLRKLLGEQNFRSLARLYVRSHPPRTPLMMFFGEDMPAFLEGFEPLRHIGYLPDIARLELTLRQSYHAADAAPLDPAHLAALSPDQLAAARIGIAPSARVLRSDWPIHAIWRFNTEEGAPKPAMAAEDVLVARPEFDPLVLALPPGAAVFVGAMASRETLGDALEAAQTEAPAFDLAATLGLLLANTVLTELETAP